MPAPRVRHGWVSSAEVAPPPQGRGTEQWVVTRSLCRYRLLDLSAIPASLRANALKLELRQWSPFTDSAYYVVLRDGHAMAWAWDQATLTKADVSAAQLIEPLLQEVPQQGVRLLVLREGFEGQYWQGGLLLSSRWWPAQPSDVEWLTFVRDAGLPPMEQAARPAPQRAALLPQPWARNALRGMAERADLLEFTAYGTVVVGLLLLFFWNVMQQHRLEAGLADLEAQKSAMRQKAAPLLDAREAAITALDRVNQLERLEAYPDQLTLLAAASTALPADGGLIRDWDFRSGKLSLTYYHPTTKISATDVVGALEKQAVFRNIRTLTGSDPKALSLQLEVVPLYDDGKEQDKHA